MELTPETIERLAKVGVRADADVQHWRGIAQRYGEAMFWRLLQRAELTAADHRARFPRLLAFAAECRSAHPVPDVIAPGSAAWGLHQVALESMRQFRETDDGQRFCRPSPCRAAIIWADRAALAAAVEVFGHTKAVILDKQEWDRWRSEHKQASAGREPRSPWFAVAHWTTDPPRPRGETGLSPADLEALRRRYAVPASSLCWTVEQGTWHDGLAAKGSETLWTWDGTRATPVALLSISVS